MPNTKPKAEGQKQTFKLPLARVTSGGTARFEAEYVKDMIVPGVYVPADVWEAAGKPESIHVEVMIGATE